MSKGAGRGAAGSAGARTALIHLLNNPERLSSADTGHRIDLVSLGTSNPLDQNKWGTNEIIREQCGCRELIWPWWPGETELGSWQSGGV